MSPTTNPAADPQTFVPLPTALPTKEEEAAAAAKADRDLKRQSKTTSKEHKPSRSLDSGVGGMSPYSFETRSPEQYSPTTRRPRSRQADTLPYESLESRKPGVRYVTRDGKIVRVGSWRQKPTANEDVVILDANAHPDKETRYRDKYKAAKETTKALEAVVADYGDAVVHNLAAAQAQETKIRALQEELERLTLKVELSQARAAAADRRYIEVQRIRQKEIEDELTSLRSAPPSQLKTVEATRAHIVEDYARPLTRTRRPTFIEQPKPPRPTTVVRTIRTVTPAVNSSLSGPAFADPLDEAAADYNRAQADIQVASTEIRRRERPRDDRRHR